MNYQARSRAEIARRVAQDIREGMYVNLLIRQLNIEMFMQHTSPSDL